MNRTWARKLDLSGDLSYFSNLQGRLDTRERTFSVRNELASGDVLRFALEGNLDRLDPTDDPFVIQTKLAYRWYW